MSRPRIVLVRPPPGPISRVVGARLPLALLRLASLLEPEFGVAVVDMAREPDWRARLREELTAPGTLAVGIGTMTGPQLRGAIAASELARAVAPDVKVVWGGVHPSLFPADVAGDPRVDLAVVGEGEHTMRELAEALDGDGALDDVAGLAFERDGALVQTARRDYTDLDALPPLPLHLVDVRRYLFADFGATDVLEYESSRGCPYDCSYCYNAAYNRRRWRAQSAETVLDELARIQRDHGVRGIGFVDDEFFIDAGRARTFFEGLERRRLPLKLIFQGLRIDTLARMDDDTLALADRCGTVSVQIGMESGSQRILDSIGKRITVEQARAQNRRLARCRSIRPYYNFMTGLPGETADDVAASVRLGWQLLQDNPRARLGPYHILVPYPGSALYDRAVAEGFRPPTTPDGWARFDFHSNRPPWLSDRMRDLARRITVASIFVDDKVLSRTDSTAGKLFTRLYGPLARWRFRTQTFRAMPERYLFDLVLERPTRRDADDDLRG